MDDPRLDEALDSIPLVALPEGFTGRVLARIEHPQVRFRLTFLDLALPTFFSMFAAIILGAAVWIYTTLDPLWLPRFILFLQLTWLEIKTIPNIPMVGFGFTLFLGFGIGSLGLALWLVPQVKFRRINTT
jgi:hypothetical protein